MDEGEKIMTVPLRHLKHIERRKRANSAIVLLQKFVSKHLNVPVENVWIDPKINEQIWTRGIEKPPSKLKVKTVKFEEDNSVEVIAVEK